MLVIVRFRGRQGARQTTSKRDGESRHSLNLDGISFRERWPRTQSTANSIVQLYSMTSTCLPARKAAALSTSPMSHALAAAEVGLAIDCGLVFFNATGC